MGDCGATTASADEDDGTDGALCPACDLTLATWAVACAAGVEPDGFLEVARAGMMNRCLCGEPKVS